jgi:Fe-S-cluster containining protein
LIVEADDLDLLREPRLASADRDYAGMPIDEILQKLQEDTGYSLIIACCAPCPFLDRNLCTIYPTRPNACVGLQAGEDQCQQARRAEGLPVLTSVGD